MTILLLASVGVTADEIVADDELSQADLAAMRMRHLEPHVTLE